MKKKDKEQSKKSLIEIIRTLVDKKYQKRVWIKAEGSECDSFDETACFFLKAVIPYYMSVETLRSPIINTIF